MKSLVLIALAEEISRQFNIDYVVLLLVVTLMQAYNQEDIMFKEDPNHFQPVKMN